eukprot:CAMPEP_0173308762 /NCGR_PEP_ID=MMETSP1143-20121109/21930_1 /TAXON_ID=483371 /ORGANISM="non described non described, Strain CCMP2298" /LENGTH=86 /DNA_ID=CAMNT_0014250229 /DNA_START=13 /DNA_END=272 /DNA_ORIENTATION=+
MLVPSPSAPPTFRPSPRSRDSSCFMSVAPIAAHRFNTPALMAGGPPPPPTATATATTTTANTATISAPTPTLSLNLLSTLSDNLSM